MATRNVSLRAKRGPRSRLPAAAEGEIVLTTDEKQVYVGANGGNIQLARLDEVAPASHSHTITLTEINCGTFDDL